MVSDYEKNKLFEVRYKQVLNIKPKEFPWQDNITGQMIKELPTKQLLWLLQREKWIILNPGKASFYPSSLKKLSVYINWNYFFTTYSESFAEKKMPFWTILGHRPQWFRIHTPTQLLAVMESMSIWRCMNGIKRFEMITFIIDMASYPS